MPKAFSGQSLIKQIVRNAGQSEYLPGKGNYNANQKPTSPANAPFAQKGAPTGGESRKKR